MSVEIVCLNLSQFSSLAFVFHDRQRQIVIDSEGNRDLIQVFFSGLSTLYFTKRFSITTQSLVGNLIASDEAEDHLCGALIPLAILTQFCEKALSYEAIKTFLQVSSCFEKLRVTEYSVQSSNDGSPGTQRVKEIPIEESVELPANTIWNLLILSECFGVNELLGECKQRVAKLFLASKQEGRPPTKLPSSVIEGIPPQYIDELESKLLAHILQFGTAVKSTSKADGNQHIMSSTATTVTSSESIAGSEDDVQLTTQSRRHQQTAHSNSQNQQSPMNASAFIRSLQSNPLSHSQSQTQHSRSLHSHSYNDSQEKNYQPVQHVPHSHHRTTPTTPRHRNQSHRSASIAYVTTDTDESPQSQRTDMDHSVDDYYKDTQDNDLGSTLSDDDIGAHSVNSWSVSADELWNSKRLKSSQVVNPQSVPPQPSNQTHSPRPSHPQQDPLQSRGGQHSQDQRMVYDELTSNSPPHIPLQSSSIRVGHTNKQNSGHQAQQRQSHNQAYSHSQRSHSDSQHFQHSGRPEQYQQVEHNARYSQQPSGSHNSHHHNSPTYNVPHTKTPAKSYRDFEPVDIDEEAVAYHTHGTGNPSPMQSQPQLRSHQPYYQQRHPEHSRPQYSHQQYQQPNPYPQSQLSSHRSGSPMDRYQDAPHDNYNDHHRYEGDDIDLLEEELLYVQKQQYELQQQQQNQHGDGLRRSLSSSNLPPPRWNSSTHSASIAKPLSTRSSSLHATHRPAARSPSPLSSSGHHRKTDNAHSHSVSQSLSESKKPPLSPEDLRISREIAMLRLREAKVKSELEASKLLAEKALRENRLKSLELKTAVLRIGTPVNGRSKSAPRSSGSRMNIGLSESIVVDAKARQLEQEMVLAEEARIRALQRIKEKRKEIEEMDAKREIEKLQKKNELFRARDEKIHRFIEQQKQRNIEGDGKSVPGPASGRSKSPEQRRPPPPPVSSSPALSVQPPLSPEDDLEVLHRSVGIYSSEALAAVGLGLSPSHAFHDADPRDEELRTHRPFADTPMIGAAGASGIAQPGQTTAASTGQSTSATRGPASHSSRSQHNSPVTKQEFLEFQVLRAWELPDCLGGTNSYVVVQIPSFGHGKTQTVTNSVDPYFGAVFAIRSPLTGGNASPSNGNLRSQVDDDMVNLADDQDGSWTKVQFLVYNKNSSISDELIAVGESDIGTLVQQSRVSPVVVELFDQDRQPMGRVELVVRRIQK